MMGPERIAPIANAPFTATATLTSSRGQQIFQLARDTQGRTYVETTEPMRRFRGSNGNAGSSGEQQVIRVTDPVAGVSYTIFPARKLILEGKLRPPRGRNTGNRRGPNREAATRSLGEQKIAGTAANGVETTTNLPARGDRPAVTLTREVWTADALHLVLKESSSGFQGRRSSYVVTSLSTNPPDPSLFTPPSGYKVRHMRGFRG